MLCYISWKRIAAQTTCVPIDTEGWPNMNQIFNGCQKRRTSVQQGRSLGAFPSLLRLTTEGLDPRTVASVTPHQKNGVGQNCTPVFAIIPFSLQTKASSKLYWPIAQDHGQSVAEYRLH